MDRMYHFHTDECVAAEREQWRDVNADDSIVTPKLDRGHAMVE